ncbi:MAG: M56 family metallopeptidase [Bacteroidota bacterium]
MNYLLHAGILLAACFLYYWFFLRSETHFQLNRWILLSCIAAAFLLPLLTIPAAWSLREQPQLVLSEQPIEEAAIDPEPASSASLNAQRTQQIIDSVLIAAGLPTTAPTESVADSSTAAIPPTSPKQPTNSITPVFETVQQATDWPRLLGWVYLAGLFVFGLHFLFQLGLLLFRMLRQPGYEIDGFRIIELPYKIAPYSFWNRIFLNPTDYDPDTFHQIVEHERIHIKQRHSLDIILAELLVVVQWCNPFAWLYRWAVEHNLEFLTDSEMLAKGTDRVNYQMNLVKVSVPNLPQGLTSNYNQTFLKKRIQMMNAKQSTARSGWKYLVLIPVLLFSVLQFNAIAQTPAPDPQVTDSALPNTPTVAPQISPSPNPIPNPAPNPSFQPAEQPSVAGQPNATPSPESNPSSEGVAGFAPLAEPEFHIDIPSGQGNQRSWTAEIDGNEICFQFIVNWNERGNHHSSSGQCLAVSELGSLPRGEMGSFELKRYSGTMTFNGMFTGNTGVGTFEFEPSNQMVGYLTSEGFGDYDWMEYLHFFYADFQPSFVAFLQREGYSPGHQKLLELMVFNFNEDNFKATLDMAAANGFSKPSLQKMIELHIFNVTPEYIEELATAGFENLSMQNVIEASIHNLDGSLAREMREAGYENLRFREILEMAIHNVDANYAAELRSAGYDPSPRKLVEAKIHNVNLDYARQLANAGFDNLSLQNVIEASIHNVDANFVQELKEMGYSDLDFREVVNMAIHDVSPQLMEELRNVGFDPSHDEIVAAAIHNVDVSYVRELANAGLEDLSLEQVIQASIHNVDAGFIQEMAAIGFEDLSFEDLVGMSIHGVDARFVRRMREAGYDLQPDELTAAAIHNFDPELAGEFKALGYDDLGYDDLMGASIHGLTPAFVRSFEEFNFRDLSFDDLIAFRIHGVNSNFIRRNFEDGDSPGDFIEMKIHGRGR